MMGDVRFDLFVLAGLWAWALGTALLIRRAWAAHGLTHVSLGSLALIAAGSGTFAFLAWEMGDRAWGAAAGLPAAAAAWAAWLKVHDWLHTRRHTRRRVKL